MVSLPLFQRVLARWGNARRGWTVDSNGKSGCQQRGEGGMPVEGDAAAAEVNEQKSL